MAPTEFRPLLLLLLLTTVSCKSNPSADTQLKLVQLDHPWPQAASRATQAAAASRQDQHSEAPEGQNRTDSPGEGGALQQPQLVMLPLYMRILATIACVVIFTVGICGNLLVPLVVIKTKYLRNSTNLFLINLSVADLLVLSVCMPTVLIELHSRPETWLLGEPMCKYGTV